MRALQTLNFKFLAYKILLPILLIIGIFGISNDSWFYFFNKIDSREDLKLLNLFLIFLGTFLIYSSIEITFLERYTQAEYSSMNNKISDIFVNTLFMCMIFSNKIENTFIPLILIIFLIKINTEMILNRLKMEFNKKLDKMAKINFCILTILLGILIRKYKKGLESYFAFQIIYILLDYVTIFYHTKIIKDKPENEYKTTIYHLISLVVVGLKVILIFAFLLMSSLIKKVPFSIFNNLRHEGMKFKRQLIGFIAYLRIEKLLRDVEKVSDIECPICTDNIVDGRKLACGHSFHLDCLKEWVLQQQVCPVCRVSVFGANTGISFYFWFGEFSLSGSVENVEEEEGF